MSRSFISTANGHVVEDDEGVEVPNCDPLRTVLRHTLTAILHDEGAIDGATDCGARADDEDGKLVMQARVGIDITGR